MRGSATRGGALRSRARERNIGWRIDYVCISESLRERLREAFILDSIMGSDHCPVGIELEGSCSGRLPYVPVLGAPRQSRPLLAAFHAYEIPLPSAQNDTRRN